MTDLTEVRGILLARRGELEARLNNIKRDVTTPLDHDFAEQAVELENGEVLQALGHEVEHEIADINRALNRMDAGDYGSCVSCGKIIPAARLKVQPFADHCVACAEVDEKRR